MGLKMVNYDEDYIPLILENGEGITTYIIDNKIIGSEPSYTLGFHLDSWTNATIKFNQILNSSIYGLKLETSINITIYPNNFIDNN